MFRDFANPLWREKYGPHPTTLLARPTKAGVYELQRTFVAIVDGDAWSDPAVYRRYVKLVPQRLGGENVRATPREYREAVFLCYDEVDLFMVRDALAFLVCGAPCIFMIARDQRHQKRLEQLLLARATRLGQKLDESDICMIGITVKRLHLTDAAVAAGSVPDYKIVITTVNKNAGYSVTRSHVMLTSVYPSNLAKRRQLEGSEIRRGQASPIVQFRVYHTGLLSRILARHDTAESLEAALRQLE